MTITGRTTPDPLPAIGPPRPEHLRLADIEARLRGPEPAVRAAALKALAEIAGTEDAPRGVGDTLAWALADEHEDVRRLAADALRGLPEVHLGDDGVDALLLAAARGRDPFVRETAADLLAILVQGTGELYAQGLQDDEPQVRLQAVLGLVGLRAVRAVAEAADDPSREIRVAVAEGLARLAAPAGTPALDHLLADHDPVVVMAALDAAARLGVPEPLEGRVVTAVAHPSWQVRRRAAFALGAATPETAVRPLVRALRDPTADVRRAAVQSLEQWTGGLRAGAGRPEVVTALTEALADPDPGVRTQARWALA
ncbi:HEAT repeat domain-containing protein [Actinomadura xylanilytica]|uniref:HEAT repeat domain-containing protein n=1 Tax=Actinomadura xylanilytica TaxID=887459 RepID=UPI00255B3ED6|nr:HEAT repeat domain-containing protein [Actinomadura xylanilytica]MDL4771668.1 HEAT repeat domain-containing protein [Actinomadura xylanilytica]